MIVVHDYLHSHNRALFLSAFHGNYSEEFWRNHMVWNNLFVTKIKIKVMRIIFTKSEIQFKCKSIRKIRPRARIDFQKFTSLCN